MLKPQGFKHYHFIKTVYQFRAHPVGNQSFARIRAVRCLLSSIQELNRARREREERATLWPIEELPDNERILHVVFLFDEMGGKFALAIHVSPVAGSVTVPSPLLV